LLYAPAHCCPPPDSTLDVLLCKLVKEARNDLFQGIVTFLQLKEVCLRNISNPIVIKELWSTHALPV
jgi:hypothetical protein